MVIKFLQKIAWRTRRWNLKFNLLEVYLHDGDGCWGFSLCEIIKNHRPYSLLAIEFRLPNGAEITGVQYLNWDILYLNTILRDWLISIEEDMLWGYKPTLFEKKCLMLVKKMYKV